MLLLATEWTLLQTPPLALGVFREQVADLALRTIVDIGPTIADTRGHALAVLRMASKAFFAESFVRLFNYLSRDLQDRNRILMGSLLYCAFTMLHGSHRLPEFSAPLGEALEQVWKESYISLLESENPDALSVAHTLALLRDYARVQQTSYGIQKLGEENWSEARRQFEELLVGKVSAWKVVWSMNFKGFALETFRSQSASQWAEWFEIWEPVHEALIASKVFHLLSSFSEEISVLDPGGRSTQWLLSRENGLLKCSSEFTHLLKAFSVREERAQSQSLWQSFEQARQRLWDDVFDPGISDGDEQKGGSTLARIIRGCPVDLSLLLEDSLGPTFVYCHRDLIHSLIGSMRRECPESRLKIEKLTDEEQAQKPQTHSIRVRLESTNKKEQDRARRILAQHQASLSAWRCEVRRQDLLVGFREWGVSGDRAIDGS